MTTSAAGTAWTTRTWWTSTIRFKAKALKRPVASADSPSGCDRTTTSAIRAAPKSKTAGTAEMDSIDIAIDEVRVKGVICPKCGGYGGEQLNLREHDDQGWMPCYYCGNSGYISYAQWMEELEQQEINA